jgi:hypothetical protein
MMFAGRVNSTCSAEVKSSSGFLHPLHASAAIEVEILNHTPMEAAMNLLTC